MLAELCLPSSELDHLHFYIRRTNRQWKISWPQETKATVALPPTLFHCENNSSSWAPTKDFLVTPMKHTLSHMYIHVHLAAYTVKRPRRAQSWGVRSPWRNTREQQHQHNPHASSTYSGKNNLHLSPADGGNVLLEPCHDVNIAAVNLSLHIWKLGSWQWVPYQGRNWGC